MLRMALIALMLAPWGSALAQTFTPAEMAYWKSLVEKRRAAGIPDPVAGPLDEQSRRVIEEAFKPRIVPAPEPPRSTVCTFSGGTAVCSSL